LLGFGVYSEIKLGSYVTFSANDLASGPRLLIAVGIIIAVIAFFGCCGAWKESKCLLIIVSILILKVHLMPETILSVLILYEVNS
jgi:CD63 antigen